MLSYAVSQVLSLGVLRKGHFLERRAGDESILARENGTRDRGGGFGRRARGDDRDGGADHDPTRIGYFSNFPEFGEGQPAVLQPETGEAFAANEFPPPTESEEPPPVPPHAASMAPPEGASIEVSGVPRTNPLGEEEIHAMSLTDGETGRTLALESPATMDAPPPGDPGFDPKGKGAKETAPPPVG